MKEKKKEEGDEWNGIRTDGGGKSGGSIRLRCCWIETEGDAERNSQNKWKRKRGSERVGHPEGPLRIFITRDPLVLMLGRANHGNIFFRRSFSSFTPVGIFDDDRQVQLELMTS